MLKDRICDYYLNRNFNCAESLLHAANDEYDMKLTDESFKLIGGFGGGMGCGKACGALCAGISVIGNTYIKDRAHTTKNLKAVCTDYVNSFMEALGSDACEKIRPAFVREGVRCLDVICLAADVLEKTLNREPEEK